MGIRNWLEAPAAAIPAPGRRGLNIVRGTVARITTPLLPDDYLHLINPLWSARELRGRVVRVRKETADSATLVIRPGWGFDFGYQAGQYIGIGLLLDGRWHWRSYSLTSVPENPRDRHGLISIAVKAMPEGFLSSHLVNGVPAGTIVRLAAPQGGFLLPQPPPRKILFLTAGSGVTPVLAMLRSLDRHGDLGDVAHIHCAPAAAEVMFSAELRSLARRHPGYALRTWLTQQEGRFSLDLLDELLPDWRERQTWACGPAALLDDAEQAWQAAGIAERLHQERFDVTRTAAGAGGTVTFAKSGQSVAADGATTLLEAGEQAGVRMPFGCRMGICHTCVVTLTDGHAWDLRSGAERSAGDRIQTCVCAPAGNCTIDC